MSRADRDQQAEFELTSRIREDLPIAALRRMARDATARNEARGVTGEMRLEGRRLHQIIEGPSDTILLLASAILSDARHEGIDVRSFRLIGVRRFADWRVLGIDGSRTFCALRVGAPVEFIDAETCPETGRPTAWSAALGDTADRRA